MSKKLLVLVLLLSMLVVVSGCGGAGNPDTAQTPDVSADAADVEKVTLMLDWTPNTNHTGFYVAQALGYYEEAGLQLEIIQPSEDGANMAVAAGQAQFGVGFQETLLPAITADAPLPITAIAAILAHNTSGLISMKDKNIASFKDLEGVSYASWDTPSELEIIRECMSAQGGDFAALKLVPNSGADALSLMQSGDIDVVWVYEGWDVQMAELAGLDYNFISFREAAPVLDFYTPVIITGNDFLTQSPETVKAFLTATARGFEYAIDNPEQAAELLVKAVPELSLDLVKLSQIYLAGQYREENQPWGVIDEARWSAFNAWMYEKGLIGTEVGSGGYTNAYLPQ